jgi:nicotinamidase-related amidase
METEMPEVKGVWHAQDVALILIDYQKEMFENVKSETGPDEIELNVRFLIRVAKAFNIPVILSTVGVQIGVNGPTRPAIQNELPGLDAIDRTSMDAWEDTAFRTAVNKTGKERLIFCALYTCLAFPIIDAMRDGYEALSSSTPFAACRNWPIARPSSGSPRQALFLTLR